MKTAKKLLAVSLAMIMLLSLFTIVASAAASNITITKPQPDEKPDWVASVDTSMMTVVNVDWYAYNEDTEEFERMTSSDVFQSGVRYKVYMNFLMNPFATDDAYNEHTITINGKEPTKREGHSLEYDFGVCRVNIFTYIWTNIIKPIITMFKLFQIVSK